MNRLVLSLVLFLASVATLAAEEPKTLSGAKALAGKRVLTLGDSISQDGRYLSYVEYYLQKQHPALDFDIVNAGLASETTSGLSEEGHPGPRPCVHDRLIGLWRMLNRNW